MVVNYRPKIIRSHRIITNAFPTRLSSTFSLCFNTRLFFLVAFSSFLLLLTALVLHVNRLPVTKTLLQQCSMYDTFVEATAHGTKQIS